jgi:membrane protease subunit HflC
VQQYLRPVLAVLFVLAIVAFAFSYTVRFTEKAVVTTFGRAGEDAVVSEPGLKFKWPFPIQSVTKYDTRVRVLQTRSQTQQTADDSQIIVEAFATWRVSNPLAFFQRFSNAGGRAEDHYAAAEEILRTTLRSALGETSKFRLDQLFNPDPTRSRLAELEGRIFALLATIRGETGEAAGGLGDYGIEVTMVGINRIVLPEDTTNKVIERMGANRDRLAQELESQGTARATAIRAKAEADARKIRAFADRRAAEIRAKGEDEAAEFLAQQASNPDLAIFLQNISLLRESMAKRFTLVLSASDFGMGLFSPTALEGLRPGEFPTNLPGDRDLFRGRASDDSMIRGAVEGTR